MFFQLLRLCSQRNSHGNKTVANPIRFLLPDKLEFDYFFSSVQVVPRTSFQTIYGENLYYQCPLQGAFLLHLRMGVRAVLRASIQPQKV
jgi:hypothetical protein